MIRGKTAKVEEKNGRLLIRGEDILKNELIENSVDMVVLSVGLEPGEDTAGIAKMLNIPVSEGGWLEEVNYDLNPTGTIRGGVILAGTCQGPKDIPDSVAQGSAAAARVLQTIIRGKTYGNLADLTLERISNKIKELTFNQ